MSNTRTVSPQQELRRSLNLVILAITFGMAFFTVVNGPTLAAFARTLGSGDFLYSVVMSMPVFTGLLQVFASMALRRAGRRKVMFIAAGFIHRLLMIPIAMVPLFIPSQFQGARIWIIVILLAISSGGNAFTSIIFGSWMGALIPGEIRGRYFSRRAMISTITSALTAPLAGLFLDHVPGPQGYAILFLVVSILGAMDMVCFIWVKDPEMPPPPPAQPFFHQFAAPLKDTNYRRFILFTTLFLFGVNLSGPFFTPHMLENLHMSMLNITLFVQTVMSITTVFFISRTGRMVDRFGVKPIMNLCVVAILAMPFMWLFVTPSSLWVIVIIHILSGIVWPTYDLANMNFSIWLAPEEERPNYLATYALITSVCGALPGQLIGGAIMENLRPWMLAHPLPWFGGMHMVPFHVLLIISGLFRLAAVVFLFPGIHDPEQRGSMRDVLRAFVTSPASWKKK